MVSKFQRREAAKGDSNMAEEVKPAATEPVQVTVTEGTVIEAEVTQKEGSEEVQPEPAKTETPKDAPTSEASEGGEEGNEDFDGPFDPERAKHTIKQFREREKIREKKEKELARKLGEVAGELQNANQKILSFEEKQAAKQQQFEELAVERGTRIQELEQTIVQAKAELEGRLHETTVRTETLTTEVHKLVDDEVRSWPDKVRGLVPKRTEASAEERLERMRAAREVAIELMNATAEPLPGNGPTPNNSHQNRQPEAPRSRSRIYEVI